MPLHTLVNRTLFEPICRGPASHSDAQPKGNRMDLKPHTQDLGASFSQSFELIPALDQASKEQVYRVRHDVYCRDLGWEAEREDGLESDEFDRHSLHCLLRRRVSAEPVGCVRLILAHPNDPTRLLPIEKSCRDVIDREILDPSKLPRHTVGEVSRLAVLNTFRQRKGEADVPMSVEESDFGGAGTIARFPFIPVSLFLGAAAMAKKIGVEHALVLTEPRLARHFARIGFDIQTIGGATEHRGARLPSVLSSSKVVAGLRPIIRPLYDIVEAAVESGFQAHPELLPHRSALA